MSQCIRDTILPHQRTTISWTSDSSVTANYGGWEVTFQSDGEPCHASDVRATLKLKPGTNGNRKEFHAWKPGHQGWNVASQHQHDYSGRRIALLGVFIQFVWRNDITCVLTNFGYVRLELRCTETGVDECTRARQSKPRDPAMLRVFLLAKGCSLVIVNCFQLSVRKGLKCTTSLNTIYSRMKENIYRLDTTDTFRFRW